MANLLMSDAVIVAGAAGVLALLGVGLWLLLRGGRKDYDLGARGAETPRAGVHTRKTSTVRPRDEAKQPSQAASPQRLTEREKPALPVDPNDELASAKRELLEIEAWRDRQLERLQEDRAYEAQRLAELITDMERYASRDPEALLHARCEAAGWLWAKEAEIEGMYARQSAEGQAWLDHMALIHARREAQDFSPLPPTPQRLPENPNRRTPAERIADVTQASYARVAWAFGALARKLEQNA